MKAPGRVVSSPSPVSQGAIIPCLVAPALFHLDLCFCGHVSCDSPVSLSWDLGITLGPPRQPRTSTPISRSLSASHRPRAPLPYRVLDSVNVSGAIFCLTFSPPSCFLVLTVPIYSQVLWFAFKRGIVESVGRAASVVVQALLCHLRPHGTNPLRPPSPSSVKLWVFNAHFIIRKIPWRRQWQPSPVFLPGKSHGQRSLVGCSSWAHKELDTTEWLTLS